MIETDSANDSYHHGDLRRALLDAALELIREEGTASLSLRAVARRAGVSHAAPYHHFDNRASLVAAVAEEGFVALRRAMVERMEGVRDPGRQLQEAGIGYVLFALEEEAHFRVMYSSEVADRGEFPALQSASAGAYAVLGDALARCREEGLVPSDGSPAQGHAAWSIVHGLAMLILDGHVPPGDDYADVEEMAREVTSQLWRGLVGASADD